MSEFGIHTADHHLDALVPPPGPTADGQQSEFSWSDFQSWATASNWNGGRLPVFAGRYFLGGGTPNTRTTPDGVTYLQPPFQWAHAEGSAATASDPDLARVAPLQAADLDRQETTGFRGVLYGSQDAIAFCERLTGCLVSGELSVTGATVYVYLDVLPGTALSQDYWAGWAGTVSQFTVPGQPAPTQPFLPCICCSFSRNQATGGYALDPQVQACLDTVQTSYTAFAARCYGFWAKAPVPLDQVSTSSAPDFGGFGGYSQPISATGTVPVWVLIWRYAEQSDPPDDTFAGGNRVSLDATQEAAGSTVVFDRMLAIEDYTLAGSNTAYLGIDQASPFTLAQAQCVLQQTSVTRTRAAGQSFATKFTGPLTFVMRYYSTPASAKLLKADEITSLATAGLHVGVVWETSATGWQQPPAGHADGLAAFSYAASLQQPEHTPVYFALDGNPAGGTDNNGNPIPPFGRDVVEAYFDGVLSGYLDYQLQQTDPIPYEIGVYGAGAVLRWCYVQGIAGYFWETGSWSWTLSGPLFPHANLVQFANETTLTPCGLPNVDYNASWGDEGAFP